ncbi:MAG TPA: glycoside hydrolase family 3 N-terminal domain-containing protein [Anaerolineales bacterium]|nr:glycoside hydrolase family 3 N-terminal domain-containing protein [Anaerolineales bacterium]
MAIPERVAELLTRMTLEEKIGQMTQVEKNSLTPEAVKQFFIGSVLSGGGGYPANNTPAGWARMVSEFQEAALSTRLRIPLLYGVDAVHGHNNLFGAVMYPHNIGLGAACDSDLVYRIGRATAEELAATGIYWNFAPTVAVPQDIRWGRTYEGYGQDSHLVTRLAMAYIQGLQGERLSDPLSVLATPKHYLGDGGTIWGSSRRLFPIPPGSSFAGPENLFEFKIDQGDTRLDEATLRAVHLAPYIAAVQAGAQVVMASFSSWNGVKLHAHHYLLTEVLKGELGFSGFVVSDWGGIDQVSGDYYQAVVAAVNAGVDMSMVPQDYERFISYLKRAVENGDILMERIDDAVRRILSVKVKAGLFERPLPDPGHLSLVGPIEHRWLAREAVARSLVLLKNEAQTLPLSKSTATILVGGRAADDIGLQCGGWTIEWLGKSGAITPGTTILSGVRTSVSPSTRLIYDPDGQFGELPDTVAEVGIAVLAEMPYAEGFGDRADLTLPVEDIQLIERMRLHCRRLVLILLSGRPLIITDQLPLIDAMVAAWLPGTEGQGVADVLFGDLPFTGKLSYNWPRSLDQVPINHPSPPGKEVEPLFPFGYGLLARADSQQISFT